MKIFANNRQASKYQVETTCLNAWLLQQSVLIHSEIVKELEGTFYFMLCMSMSILENSNRDPDQESFVLTVQFTIQTPPNWTVNWLRADDWLQELLQCSQYTVQYSTQYSRGFYKKSVSWLPGASFPDHMLSHSSPAFLALLLDRMSHLVEVARVKCHPANRIYFSNKNLL